MSYLSGSRPYSRGGFTLIEIIVALFIFAILAVLATTSLYNILNARQRITESSAYFTELQIANVLLGRDINQLIDRPILDSFGETQPALIGTDTSIEFTRTGFSNPFSQAKRSNLLRVAYSLQNSALIRTTWRVLDRAPATKPDMRRLISGVRQINFSYYAKAKIYHSWPPADLLLKNSLPAAIQMTISIKNWGKITRLWTVPATELLPPQPAQP